MMFFGRFWVTPKIFQKNAGLMMQGRRRPCSKAIATSLKRERMGVARPQEPETVVAEVIEGRREAVSRQHSQYCSSGVAIKLITLRY